ncbi:MAG TPA: hypothetical protein VIJ60_05000 [Acidimicrobiales bacterium]
MQSTGVHGGKASTADEQLLRGQALLPYWSKLGHRLARSRDRHGLASFNAIDDVATVVAKLTDGHRTHV